MKSMRAMAKAVCIVGAGPSGIIAAKTLLHNHPKESFKVTVFEQCGRIGGLWPLNAEDDGMVNPEMCVNLSRHTVSFSDLAWPESSPSFPKAWQVGQYLKKYLDKYSGIDIWTSCKVVKASRSSGAIVENAGRWIVEVQQQPLLPSHIISPDKSDPVSKDAASHSTVENELPDSLSASLLVTHYFDYLIVASGFFGKPRLPFDLPTSSGFPVPVQHSTQFRNVEELLKRTGNDTRSQGSKILVIGGSISGAEVAASIAMQLSSEMHSPTASHIYDASKYTIHHVVSRPFWVLPLFLPGKPMLESNEDHLKNFDSAPTFLPLDLVMYNLGKRPPGQIKNNSGHITREGAAKINEYLRSLVGTDQSDLSYLNDSLLMRGEILNEAPWLAISDSYAEFVRSGRITLTTGKVVRLDAKHSPQGASIVVSSGNEEQLIEDVAAIVLATGFEATNSLSFLPEDVLQTLGYDPKCSPLPLVLDVHSTVHHDIPDLGFVGFYKGPYWGVIEMQARFLARLWAGDEKATKALTAHVSDVPELRKCYYESPKQLAQFPMGDYTYLMDSFQDILGLESAGEARKGPVLPARYTPLGVSDDARQESSTARSIVDKIYIDSTHHGKFIAKAIFRSLQGDWKLDRSLISSITTYPSGKFQGTAKFLPRHPTDTAYDAEYLYIEEGDFETEHGMKFRASRRYAYRYQETTDTLSVWFIKGDNKSVDYLFHALEILLPQDRGGADSPSGLRHSDNSGHTTYSAGNESSGWKARAHHLCIADTYDVQYTFHFRGCSVQEWSLGYAVKGPSKDYRIKSCYTR